MFGPLTFVSVECFSNLPPTQATVPAGQEKSRSLQFSSSKPKSQSNNPLQIHVPNANFKKPHWRISTDNGFGLPIRRGGKVS